MKVNKQINQSIIEFDKEIENELVRRNIVQSYDEYDESEWDEEKLYWAITVKINI